MSIKHYEGELGVFDYDDKVFEVLKNNTVIGDILHFKNKGNLLSVNLPIGCVNTRYMFFGCTLPEGFSLGDNFDTSNVEDMNCMFKGSTLPKGFSLGNKFDTSNVENMYGMFEDCALSEGFTLGDNFNTSNVETMAKMFYNCTIPQGFSLGNKFDTISVEFMDRMFYGCTIPADFSLGDNFDTSNVENMGSMFSNCRISEGFSLGGKFDTSNVELMHGMFQNCTLPQGFSLGDNFDTSNVENMYGMFEGCVLPTGFFLGNKFKLGSLVTPKTIFKGCIFPKDFDATKFNLETKQGVEELIKSLNEYSQSTKKEDLGECTKLLVKLLKEGNNMEESKKILAEKYRYSTNSISSCVLTLNSKFSDKCTEALKDLLTIDSGKVLSKYSIGDVVGILNKQGYPREIINDCIVKYLWEEHLSV